LADLSRRLSGWVAQLVGRRRRRLGVPRLRPVRHSPNVGRIPRARSSLYWSCADRTSISARRRKASSSEPKSDHSFQALILPATAAGIVRGVDGRKNIKLHAVILNLAQDCQVIRSFLPRSRSWGCWGFRGCMPYHFNPLVFFVSLLAAAMFLCLNLDTGEASECVGRPDRSVNQAGHWHSRVHHRRCWPFELSNAGAGPTASNDRGPAQNTDSQRSWFSGLTTGLAKTFSKQSQQSGVQHGSISSFYPQPPENTVVDNSIVITTVRSNVVLRAGPGADFSAIGHVPGGTDLEMTDCMGGWCQVEFNGIAGFVGAADLGNVTPIQRSSARRAENRKLSSPRYLRTNKIVSREGLQTKPPPATNGVANAERDDQLTGNGKKNEQPAPQLRDTERQEVFDDFLKWYLTVRLNP
jgi:Bacterial SH3 domain